MMQVFKSRVDASERQGAAVVELALVLPLILTMLVGLIEIGMCISVRHTLSEAARTGARVYSLKQDKTEGDVRAAVEQVMKAANLSNYSVKLDPDPSTAVEQLAPLTVTVSISSRDALGGGLNWFMKNSIISADCMMPADLGKASLAKSSGTQGSGLPWGQIDTDPGEGSGTTNKTVDALQKTAQKLKEEAEKAQQDADKENAKALEEQFEADLAAQEAAAAAQKAAEAARKAATDKSKSAQDAAKKAQKAAEDAQEDAAKAQEKAAKAQAKSVEKAAKASNAWKAAKAAASLVP